VALATILGELRAEHARLSQAIRALEPMALHSREDVAAI